VSGTGTLLDRLIRKAKPTRLTLWVRPEMVSFCRQRLLPQLSIPVQINTPLDDEPALLVSGRILQMGELPELRDPAVALDAHGLYIAHCKSPGLSPRDMTQHTDAWLSLHELPLINFPVRRANYLWDLIGGNQDAIISDSLDRKPIAVPAGPHHAIHPEKVWVGEQVKLGAGCVLDASQGPVIIEASATIGANAVLIGPCWIGPGAAITPLSLIRPGTSIGPGCKIGGEVSNSIFIAHSNKPHDGYVGDSYIGEWVNFGAGSTTSNLKNTYSNISINMGGRDAPTGRQFMGSLVGDHTKLAIGTRLMTGTYIGACCMIASSKLPPTTISSFTFLTDAGAQPYDRDKAREMMTAVYRRRGRQWEPFDDELITYAANAAAQVEKTSM
jgi:UDP-N-acetylglucosamine diphosphorylase/glucosamine-1-phosphate N-acetyltransferase